MDTQDITSEALKGSPSIMPWQAFAEWIQMGEEPEVVRGWIARGYIPSVRIGKRVMVNIRLFDQQLLEQEA